MSLNSAGAEFSGPSWATWRIIARLIDGDAHLLTLEEQALVLRLTGLSELPAGRPRENLRRYRQAIGQVLIRVAGSGLAFSAGVTRRLGFEI